jgi:uncharacterized protein (DUF2249 family)
MPELGGDAACWLHQVCESCGALIEGSGSHRPGCAAVTGVRELDVCSLPRAQKHPTIFRLLEELSLGETLRISNDHDPQPLRLALERSGPGAFAWEYLERGPDRWRVDIRKIGSGGVPRLGIETGPVVIGNET